MKLNFLGSGGYLRIPRACCTCKICSEARTKGTPYERLCQALFIEDENILFDTPEDINTELNRNEISKVEHLFYSHWHPDHTAGYRILETLKAGRETSPVKIYLNEVLKKDFEAKVPALFYFEKQGYCKVIQTDQVKIGSIEVELVKLNNSFAYAFLIEQENKKAVFCPCHSTDLIVTEKMANPDVLIVNLGYFGKEQRNMTGFEKDNIPLIERLKPKQTIFTHIEEVWGKGYDEYCKLEEEYKQFNIRFAFDEMTCII